MSKVQEALKAAIEAFELHAKQYPHMVKGYCVDALEDCKSALSDIEKCEPVAYMYEYPSKFEGWTTRTLSVSLEPDLHHLVKVTPLYTSPISKEWVDVPYEERRELYKSVSKGNIDGFADLLSAKLKQLNTEKG